MSASDRTAAARRHLDARLSPNAAWDTLQRPPRGWVKAIREALGMTTAQLARRMHIAQSSVVLLEHSEEIGRIQLDTLQRAAAALDCRVVYALVPRQPLETQVQARRALLAEHQLTAVEHSMRLENQAVTDPHTREHHLRELAAGIAASTLWDES